MPGTASFSSASSTSRTTRGGGQHRTSLVKNSSNKNQSEAGFLVWDAPPSLEDTRRRRPRTDSSFASRQAPSSVLVLHDGEDPQLVLSSLLRDLSFWEVQRCRRPIEETPSRIEGPRYPSSEAPIHATDRPHQEVRGGAEGSMISTSRSGLLSRSGQRVAAMPEGEDGFGNRSEGVEKMGMAGFVTASNQQPLRRQPPSSHKDESEEKKVESSLATAGSDKPAPPSGRVWKSAVDPSSGRTYYYDAATRQTQWEKPEEIRAEERRIKKEKRRLEQIFFEEVRANVLASLARGELIPGVPRNETTSQGPPLEPVLSPTSSLASLSPTSLTNDDVSSKNRIVGPQPPQQRVSSGSSNARIRTISGMNEKLLAELHNPPPSVAALNTSRSNVTRAPPAGPNTSALPLAPSTNEGRPPLPRGRSLTLRDDRAASVAASVQYSRAPAAQSKPNDHYFATQDSLELSPDPVVHHKQRASTTTAAAAPGSIDAVVVANEAADLEGERLLDGPIFGGEVATVSSTSAPGNKPKKGDDGTSLSTSSHMRRNTGGTVFVQSTMENPNIKATIKCVCGVYRAHVVSSAASSSTVSSRDSLSTATFEIFRDETHRDYRRVVSPKPVPSPPVPSLQEIETFYFDFYRRSQMEQDTIIMSLIYVERLIKETNGALTPSPSNWKSILFSCMVLSSKVWDDLSMFNLDFSNVSMAVSTSQSVASATGATPAPSSPSSLSSFSLQRTNALEVALLQTLNFNVRVAASEYAKYYFLIRTMLLRSGLLDESTGGGGGGSSVVTTAEKESNATTVPPIADDGRRLENRSSRYQDQLQRRAKSVDWTFGSASSMSEPVLKDSVCLEQLLANQRS